MSATAKPVRKRAPRRKKATPEELRAALKDQPVVGLVEAARMLGVKPPNITRLRQQGRMPAGVVVKGSAMVYIESEVAALAKVLDKGRSAR